MIALMRRLLRRRKTRALAEAAIPDLEGRGSNPEERAEYLLRSHLSPDQLSEYDATKTFVAVGQITKLPYRIFPLKHHNILLRDRIPMCVTAVDRRQGVMSNMPIADHMLTHKLYIENAEENFLATVGWSARTALAIRYDLHEELSIGRFRQIYNF